MTIGLSFVLHVADKQVNYFRALKYRAALQDAVLKYKNVRLFNMFDTKYVLHKSRGVYKNPKS